MNVSAANALLKTLEEPHPNNYLFLATDSPGALMATVRSRCQRLQFHTPSFEESLDWLRANVVGEEDEVKLLVAANNHPVRAIELAQSGAYEAQQAFITTLCDLLIGNQSVSQGVNQAGKLGEDSAVGYLLNTSTILIKYLLGESQQQGGDYVSLLGISELLRDSDQDKKYQIACLLAFYESALACRQQLQSSTNPNPQLIMESLLWRWHQLPLGIRAC
jgi:DNA polymerase-3 subunit delta'